MIFQSGRFLVGHHRLVHSPNFGPTNRWRLLLHPERGVDWLTRDTVLVGVMILASTSSPVHGTLDVRSNDGDDGEPCQLCSALYPMASARMSSEEACESYIRWDTGHFFDDWIMQNCSHIQLYEFESWFYAVCVSPDHKAPSMCS